MAYYNPISVGNYGNTAVLNTVICLLFRKKNEEDVISAYTIETQFFDKPFGSQIADLGCLQFTV